tara:strand:+ start:2277 stop:4022 length:1746 start_codon:yes stop_codon:yes gene_type:complete
MALTKITKTGITDASVERAKLGADAVDATKIADAAISEEHLDKSVIIGNTELSEVANSGDILLIYDASAGVLKKILASNINSAPTITSISPTVALSGDGTGNFTFTITGTNYNASATAFFVTNSGTEVNFDSVTRNSATQITGVIAKSSLPGSGEPYDIVVLNPNGQQSKLRNQVNVDQTPIFVTASGSLGDAVIAVATSFSVNATDPESAGNVTFELQSGSLPPSYSLTNTAAEGGTAIIAGTDGTTSSTTTFNFVLRAVDAASNTSSRAFSIRSRVPATESFTSSGTFSVPAGITQCDVLVVAGGGGGGNGPSNDETGGGGGGGAAGGLVFMPNYPVTASGTITVTVGDGSAQVSPETGLTQGGDGQDSVFGAPSNPGIGQGGVLTAKGGGGGGAAGPGIGPGIGAGRTGGSAGGGGGGQPSPSPQIGPATQSTQSGNSGAYGFGNVGAVGNTNPLGGGGGGGGAGAAGNTGMFVGGPGGAGKAYTIADGTTPVFYAGGGGAGAGSPNTCTPATGNAGGGGGDGGGGSGSTYKKPFPGTSGQAGQANKGGGGGAGTTGSCSTSSSFSKRGGKGVVIVRY